MLAPTFADILQLSVAERLQLMEDIWSSFTAMPESLPATEAQRHPAAQQVKRQSLQVKQRQVTIELPASFLNHRVEVIAVKVDESANQQPQRRRPHPAIAGKGRTVGDLINPIVDETEWEQL